MRKCFVFFLFILVISGCGHSPEYGESIKGLEKNDKVLIKKSF